MSKNFVDLWSSAKLWPNWLHILAGKQMSCQEFIAHLSAGDEIAEVANLCWVWKDPDAPRFNRRGTETKALVFFCIFFWLPLRRLAVSVIIMGWVTAGAAPGVDMSESGDAAFVRKLICLGWFKSLWFPIFFERVEFKWDVIEKKIATLCLMNDYYSVFPQRITDLIDLFFIIISV